MMKNKASQGYQDPSKFREEWDQMTEDE